MSSFRLDDACLAVGSMAVPEDADALVRAFTSVLASTCRAADLCSLSVRVTGRPELAVDVRRSVQATTLCAWTVQLPAGDWHDGLVLAACAPSADRGRRSAVTDTAAVLGELVVVHFRRVAAEDLAVRAVELAGRDALTDLGNRRTWRRALEQEALRSSRYGGAPSIVIIDLDNLKRLNDEHGHAAGDAHLQLASAAVRSASRTVDVVCRLGGDEFAVLAPETDADGGERLALRLRAELDRVGVRASVGVATATDGDLEATWQSADAAMYDDKRRRQTG